MAEAAAPHSVITQATRVFAWTLVFFTAAYTLNCYLTFWQDWPGVLAFFGGPGSIDVLAFLQAAIYAAAIAVALAYVMRSSERTLRADSTIMNGIVAYIVRAAFYAVLLVGIADMVISFLRVENLLPAVVGDKLATELGRPNVRGPYVHIPLILVGMVIAAFKRDLGFIWLALLV